MSAQTRSHLASRAAKQRWHPDADHTEAVLALRVSVAEDYIRKLVDAAPPLTDDQRTRLAALLRPVAPQETGARAA